MALNFPNSPTLNQIYTDSTSGFSYQWNGTVWISFSASTTNNISELDNISGSFNNSTTIFPLTVGGQSVSPASTNQLLISVGGVMQNPTDDYSVSGSNIVFTTAPTNGLTFFGTLLGTAVPIGISTIGDVYNRQVYSVTGVQTSFAFPSGYTVGYLDVFRNGVRLIAGDDFTATTGNSFSLSPPAQNTDDVEAIGYKVSTIAVTEGNLINLIVNQNATVLGITTLGAGVGAGQTALLVQGNARVTGILTVGSSSITLNGTTNIINVGSGVTINGTTGTINATSFVGGSIVAGVVTATSFVGSGSGLTGVGPSSQDVTSVAGITTINLSLGNVIYFTHDTDTTVAFANTTTTQEITFIRTKDDTDTPRSITWPTSVRWPDVGVAPALQTNAGSGDAQTFQLITRDSGVNWYGWQEQVYFGSGQFLFAFGFGNNGELGQNGITQFSSPVQIPGTTWSSISGDNAFSLATKTDGTLWSWGKNTDGQLGQGDRTQFSSPRQVPGTTWSSISTGSYHSLATKTDNTLWSWGLGSLGRLGQNTTTKVSSPIQIPGTSWSSISAGNENSFAIKTDGTLWSWGKNTDGQLGQGDRTQFSSPVQIPGITWNSISAGSYHSLATKTDNTLWAWGNNQSGRLGLNDTINVSSPVQIPGTTWSSISTGTQHSLATKTDNTLWSWGYGTFGKLGQNTTTQFSSPVQIPGTTWNKISGGGTSFSLATKTDGTLWSWGGGSYGRLGQNTTTNVSSPIQIPGTSWSSVSAAPAFSLATFIIT
jgi:alpha-tubulin suppressor-like RCC1 family protein